MSYETMKAAYDTDHAPRADGKLTAVVPGTDYPELLPTHKIWGIFPTVFYGATMPQRHSPVIRAMRHLGLDKNAVW
jgi:hypothetical protein